MDEALDASLLPATGVYTESGFARMVFHGIPGGKEITGFAGALLNAGGAAKPLDKPTLKDIGKIKKPVNIQVCVSLACHHCAQLVMSAQRAAWENPLVTAHMIDANLYPELVKQYQIQRVPLTVFNGEKTVPGGKDDGRIDHVAGKAVTAPGRGARKPSPEAGPWRAGRPAGKAVGWRMTKNSADKISGLGSGFFVCFFKKDGCDLYELSKFAYHCQKC